MSFVQYYQDYKEKYADVSMYEFAENSAELVFLKRYQPVGKKTPMHRHQFFQINYVAAGEGVHELADHKQPIGKGDILMIPPYIPHRIVSENAQCEIVEFEFALAFVNQNFTDFSVAASFVDFAYLAPFFLPVEELKPKCTLSGRLQFEIETIIKEALDEFNEKRPGYLLLIRALLLKLLLSVGREYAAEEDSAAQHGREVIWQAVQFMQENRCQKLSLEQVAERFSFSPSHFGFLFKSVTSVPFSEYLITLRLNRAVQLLCDTLLPVSEIGRMAGFQSAPHFYRCFRERIGQTPAAFRRHSGGI